MAPSDTYKSKTMEPNVLEILARIDARLSAIEAKPQRPAKAAPAAPAPGSVTSDGRAYRIVDGPMPAGCEKWVTMLGTDGVKANVQRVERGYLVTIGSSSTITDTVAEAKMLLRGAVLLSMHLAPVAKA